MPKLELLDKIGLLAQCAFFNVCFQCLICICVFVTLASKVVAERRSLVNNSVKRKGSSGDDVDHVFLRFGKRG